MMKHISLLGLLAVVATACTTEAPVSIVEDEEAISTAADVSSIEIAAEVAEIQREQVVDDIYHYTFLLKVGNTPNARIRVHRIVREGTPWRADPKRPGIMLLHGDFASFSTNFALPLISAAAEPDQSLAVHLAKREIDVWGLDRRWTNAPKDGADFSDFADMGVVQANSDIERALRFARSIRARTGAGHDKMILGGFSSGAQLTYLYAAEETQKPQGQRHIKGIVPMDIYATIAPEDGAARQVACDNAAYEQESVELGYVDSDNSAFFQPLGELAASDPTGPSPFFDGYTNRDGMLIFMTQTYFFYEPKPEYHLVAGTISNGEPTGLRYTSEALVADWLANSPPHQSMRESADRDAIWCGAAPLPLVDHLADITVPLYYIGAAGGFGDHGLYSTTVVSSTDVSSNVVRHLAVEDEPEDYGHGDLLYGDDAAALVWEPLASWVRAQWVVAH